jgi:hypothetical protein
MSKGIAAVVLPTAIAYAVYGIHTLNQQYPLAPPSQAQRLPAVLPAQPRKYGDEVDYIYARIPIGREVDDPLKTYLAAFYSTWTLRVEGLLARLTGCAPDIPSDGPPFVNGLFPVHSYSTSSVIVEWRTPEAVLGSFRKRGSTVIGGGLQELSAVVREKEMEIGFACAQWVEGEGHIGSTQMALHRFYMRFLLESARRRLERQLR